jgi:putative Mg2+ transporter-C (MgtC) family protein
MDFLVTIPEGADLIESFMTIEQWLFMVIIPTIIVFAVTFYVGLERQNVGKAAGISAHVLVGIGAMMIAIMQRIMLYNQMEMGANAEGQRVIAQVVSGIGFIGAGVIMKDGNHIIHGITTAATIWFSAMFGLLLGSGYLYEGIFFGVFVVLFITIRDLKRGFNPLKARVTSASAQLKRRPKIEVIQSDEIL